MTPRTHSSKQRPWHRQIACGVTAAVAVAILCGHPLLVGAADPPSDRVAQAETALQRARLHREQTDARSREQSDRVDQLQAEATRLGDEDVALTAQLVTSRQRLRDYAVAAYIDGGQSAIFRASLSPEKAVALSWQTNMSMGQSSSANQAAQRFEVLKASAAPARVASADQLESASRKLVEAKFDAIQAAGFERDAEAELVAAQRAQASAAAAAAAADRAAIQQQTQVAPVAPVDGETPQPVLAPPDNPPALPAFQFAVMGNPSPEESDTLARIRRCESRGNYSVVSASGRYRGAYQFDFTTWRGMGGSGDPAAASPSEQDYRALLLLRLRGTRPWPICGR